MTKKETLKWTLQIIASVITAVLTGSHLVHGDVSKGGRRFGSSAPLVLLY